MKLPDVGDMVMVVGVDPGPVPAVVCRAYEDSRGAWVDVHAFGGFGVQQAQAGWAETVKAADELYEAENDATAVAYPRGAEPKATPKKEPVKS